jgi:hypothetical protein
MTEKEEKKKEKRKKKRRKGTRADRHRQIGFRAMTEYAISAR